MEARLRLKHVETLLLLSVLLFATLARSEEEGTPQEDTVNKQQPNVFSHRNASLDRADYYFPSKAFFD